MSAVSSTRCSVFDRTVVAVEILHGPLVGRLLERLIDSHATVDALVEAADGVDLLLVGSRGLRGVRAIGSVSERLGHRAACSVLIVRDAPGR